MPSDTLKLMPDPGPLPTQAPPKEGDVIEFRVDGLPPWKDVHFSIRNPRSSEYDRFVALRNAAIAQMAGRQWYEGPVRLDLTVSVASLERGKGLVDYLGGVMDTLDGSHGPHFTYLPIVYQDDCQVVAGETRLKAGEGTGYRVRITFLGDTPDFDLAIAIHGPVYGRDV